jgi:hypothetical protein
MARDTPGKSPGWYPDPSGGTGVRWWDGNDWSSHTQSAAPPATTMIGQSTREAERDAARVTARAAGAAGPLSSQDATDRFASSVVDAGARPQRRASALGRTALVFGVLTLVLAVIPPASALVVLTSPFAVLFGIAGLVVRRRTRAPAVCGLLLGVIGFGVGIAVVGMGV